MTFDYTHKDAHKDALMLDEQLKQLGIDFVRFENNPEWQIYVINRSGKTWCDIMTVVNGVKAPRYRYIQACIKNGVAHELL